MIDLIDLKYIYENLLGGDPENPHIGDVNIEINNDLNTKHYKMQAILYPERQPYKLANIDSEAFTLSFNFYCDISSSLKKTDALEIVNRIIGYKAGTYIKDEKQYKFYSYLDLSRPMSDPMIDNSYYTQILSVTGTLLVRDAATGAIVGNDVETSVEFLDGTKGQLTVLEATCQSASTGTTIAVVNSEVGKTANANGSNTYVYKVLAMRDTVSVKLQKAATGHTRLGINETVILTEVYPDFTVTKECIIISTVIRHFAGAFAEIDLTLQEKADFLKEEEAEVE